MSMLNFFMGKLVLVEVSDLTVLGKLVDYSFGLKDNHKPSVLILENGKNRMILRGNWAAIKSLEVKAK
jgi:hypothetical protein